MTATLAIARRSIWKFMRTPQLVVVGTIQGAMFLLIFRYVFGGAIDGGSVPYVDFLVPGFITTTVLFAGMSASAGVAEDVEQGFLDRLRSLPIRAVWCSQAEPSRKNGAACMDAAVTTAIGFAVGFRLHGSIGEALGAFALCLLFGFAFSWLFVLLGLVAGKAEAAEGMSLLVFPLCSSRPCTCAPTITVRAGCSGSQTTSRSRRWSTAVRSLTLGERSAEVLGHSSGHYLVPALAWCVALVAVFAPVAIARYRRG